MVGLLICWAFVFVFLESFVIFILASNVKLCPWDFIRRFERPFPWFEFWPLSNSVVCWLFPGVKCPSSNGCSTRLWVDVEHVLWAILSVPLDLQLPSTHLVENQDYVSKNQKNFSRRDRTIAIHTPGGWSLLCKQKSRELFQKSSGKRATLAMIKYQASKTKKIFTKRSTIALHTPGGRSRLCKQRPREFFWRGRRKGQYWPWWNIMHAVAKQKNNQEKGQKIKAWRILWVSKPLNKKSNENSPPTKRISFIMCDTYCVLYILHSAYMPTSFLQLCKLWRRKKTAAKIKSNIPSHLPTSLRLLVISIRHKDPASLGLQSEPMCNSGPTYAFIFQGLNCSLTKN